MLSAWRRSRRLRRRPRRVELRRPEHDDKRVRARLRTCREGHGARRSRTRYPLNPNGGHQVTLGNIQKCQPARTPAREDRSRRRRGEASRNARSAASAWATMRVSSTAWSARNGSYSSTSMGGNDRPAAWAQAVRGEAIRGVVPSRQRPGRRRDGTRARRPSGRPSPPRCRLHRARRPAVAAAPTSSVGWRCACRRGRPGPWDARRERQRCPPLARRAAVGSPAGESSGQRPRRSLRATPIPRAGPPPGRAVLAAASCARRMIGEHEPVGRGGVPGHRLERGADRSRGRRSRLRRPAVSCPPSVARAPGPGPGPAPGRGRSATHPRRAAPANPARIRR